MGCVLLTPPGPPARVQVAGSATLTPVSPQQEVRFTSTSSMNSGARFVGGCGAEGLPARSSSIVSVRKIAGGSGAHMPQVRVMLPAPPLLATAAGALPALAYVSPVTEGAT